MRDSTGGIQCTVHQGLQTHTQQKIHMAMAVAGVKAWHMMPPECRLQYLPSSDSMPARKRGRVQDWTRVKLTPMLAAAAISPASRALAARWVVTREEEQAVSTAVHQAMLEVISIAMVCMQTLLNACFIVVDEEGQVCEKPLACLSCMPSMPAALCQIIWQIIWQINCLTCRCLQGPHVLVATYVCGAHLHEALATQKQLRPSRLHMTMQQQ